MLIVDEHVAVRTALEMRLRSSPAIEVLAAAHDVHEGRVHLKDQSPDAVLFGLKSHNRLEADCIAELIAEMAEQGIPVIVLASYADDIERERLIKAGARRYLLKDINSTLLIDEITTVTSEAAV